MPTTEKYEFPKNRLPLGLKLVYTAFVITHVVVNWREAGPLNFLWFCDIGVLATVAGVWLESRLIISVVSVQILVPMLLWMIDLCARVLLGHYIFGFAGYMFDRRVPMDVRVVSTFHLWMPLVMIWALLALGYDRRAWWIQSIFSAIVLLTCRLVSPPPPAHAVNEATNINWVYGTSDEHPQTAINSWLYLAIMIAGFPIVIYIPTQLVLCALVPVQGRLRGTPVPALKVIPATGVDA